MVIFEKGYWNLKELELSEVEKGKLNCYLSDDIRTLKSKLLYELKKISMGKNAHKLVSQKIRELFG